MLYHHTQIFYLSSEFGEVLKKIICSIHPLDLNKDQAGAGTSM